MKQNHWMSISDLMSGLMLIFLFIAIGYMNYIRNIAVTYQKLKNDLYEDLYHEFELDLKGWNAELDRELLVVRFKAPEVLFTQGSDEINEDFKYIIKDFFPRYIRILISPKYKDDIEEIRIEGHTSSEWKEGLTEDEIYLKNMELSQDRTRSVLTYILSLDDIYYTKDWVKAHLTANGLSSSKLMFTNGIEDAKRSRRVEFRVRTNAERRIMQILNSFGG